MCEQRIVRVEYRYRAVVNREQDLVHRSRAIGDCDIALRPAEGSRDGCGRQVRGGLAGACQRVQLLHFERGINSHLGKVVAVAELGLQRVRLLGELLLPL